MSKDDNTEAEKTHNQPDASKNKQKQTKSFPPTKVVIRGLPPTMTQETFVEQVSPVPDHDYLYFVRADLSLGQYAYSRAYINFLNEDDIFIFTDKFDGYVFVDLKGNEFPAVVEFAPFQKIPKRASRKKDSKCGTIETDPDFLRYLEQREKTSETDVPASTQEVLEEIEAKERELRANHGVLKMSTPLLDYLRQRKEEKIRIREEKKEERRRREADRRKMREEERRRPKDLPVHSRDSVKEKYDKNKSDKSPKQLLTYKNKESTETETNLTKKLKEVLKIDSATEKEDKQVKRGITDKGPVQSDKDRPKENYKGDQKSERQHDRNEREKERFKRREEERTRKLAARKAERKEKQDQKAQEVAPTKETKSYQSQREERQRQQEARAARTKKNDEESMQKEKVNSDTSKADESVKKDEPMKKGEEVQGSETKSEVVSKPKPERVRNKVGTEQSSKSSIKNKDRPSMQLYRPGMLKKRPVVSSSGDMSSGKNKSGPDSASTSASSSPTPPVGKEKVQRRSSMPSNKSDGSKEQENDKSDDDKVKSDDVAFKSRTFKRSFS